MALLEYDPFYRAPNSKSNRVGSDGLITIICRICEKPICRQMYQGFSTAICAVCAGEIQAGRRPEDLIRDTVAKEDKERRDVLDDLGMGGFKVAGIGKRIKDVVATVKKVAQARKRKPLFAEKDKEPYDGPARETTEPRE
jgi:hypothetical protein